MATRVHLTSLLGILTVTACGAASAPDTYPAPICATVLDGADLFSSEGLEGVFVLRDEATGCTRSTDDVIANQSFRPLSTFKIPNALIGLETGVIVGEDQFWPWDGSPQPIDAWEQDLELSGALRVSCVPCFQDVARRVGRERMARYLGDFGYGNHDISGPIDQFWLTGSLRITPREQVEFVHRMLAGELQVEMANVDLVWRLLEIERGSNFTYRGKTGLGRFDGRASGWLVGYVERDGHRWAYATLVRSRDGADVDAEFARILPLRQIITRALLVRHGVLPTAP